MSRLVLQSAGTKLAWHLAEGARSKKLFVPGEHLLVAVSGGPDSVALLALLVELMPSWNLRLSVLHFNHGLRGEESDEDERFVAGLCDRLGVMFRCERVDPGKIAGGRSKGVSLQERAREARYELLAKVGRELKVDKVALGHTADDQAETLLMWMLRGAGTAGLAGIPPARDSFFVRPLLDVTRAEILDYLEAQGLPYRTDSSNAKPLYVRNRVRSELLPLLKRYNPAIVTVLTRQGDILREEDLCLNQWVSELLARVSRREGESVLVDRTDLLALPLALQRRLVRALLRQTSGLVKGPTFQAVASVLDLVSHGRSGSRVTVRGASVERAYGSIRFSSSHERSSGRGNSTAGADPSVGLTLPVPSLLRWPPTGQVIRASLGGPQGTDPAPAQTGRAAIFDADLVTLPFLIRSWTAGDWFCPAGLGGRRKKLQDYFADIKLVRHERTRVPLLVAPEGIMWIGGYRADQRFLAGAGTVRTVTVELLDGDHHDNPSEGGIG